MTRTIVATVTVKAHDRGTTFEIEHCTWKDTWAVSCKWTEIDEGLTLPNGNEIEWFTSLESAQEFAGRQVVEFIQWNL